MTSYLTKILGLKFLTLTFSPKPVPSRTSNRALLEAMQTQTNAMLQSQKNILEAIKSSQAPSFNWEPVVDAASTLLNRLVDRIVPPMPQTSQPTPQQPGEVQVPLVSQRGPQSCGRSSP